MKLPSFIVKEIFYRLVGSPEQVKTSSTFLLRGKCPCCGDYKKRMYLKEYQQFHLIYCHNCGVSNKFQTFLKENYPEEIPYLKSYFLQSIKDGSAFNQDKYTKVEEKEYNFAKIDQLITGYLPKVGFEIEEPQKGNKEKFRKMCIDYLSNRKIPHHIWKDFWCLTKGKLAGYIGIPFWDNTKTSMIQLQGRLLLTQKGNNNQQKYLFLKDEKYGVELEKKFLWGLWRVNNQETVVICEGTLDACAFKNAVATCGATLSDSYINSIKKQFPDRVWCVDSYWNDLAGKKLTEKLLRMGEKCLIIPKEYNDIKDANNLLTKKFIDDEFIPEDFISKNIYEGKTGLTKLIIMKGKNEH